MSALCSRPNITTLPLAGTTVARCTSCASISPPGQTEDGAWSERHRGVLNRCDSCNREIGEYDGAFCGPCADDYRDAEDDR